mgnify:CR=1 FL=1
MASKSNSSNHCLLMWLWLRMGRQRAVNWDYGNGEMQSCHRYPHPTQVVCLLTERSILFKLLESASRLLTPLIIDTDGRTSVAPTPPARAAAPCRTIFKYNRVSKSLLSQMRRAWSGRHCSLDGILVKLSLWSLLTQDWATIDGWTAPAAPPTPLPHSLLHHQLEAEQSKQNVIAYTIFTTGIVEHLRSMTESDETWKRRTA